MTLSVVPSVIVTWWAMFQAPAWRPWWSRSWYHCGVRVSPGLWNELERLRDQSDIRPYRTYVVRPFQWRRRHLWRLATRIERLVFRETDNNSAFSLWWAAWPQLLRTALVVMVDQRRVHARHHMPMAMMRLTWGRQSQLATIKAMHGDPWRVKNSTKVLVDNELWWHVKSRHDLLDITMLAMLKEYTNDAYSGINVPAKAMFAQVCQFAEDHFMRWWFTVLNRATFTFIQSLVRGPWWTFKKAGFFWGPYWGSKYSQPLWGDMNAWRWKLYQQDRQAYLDMWRDGMANVCTFEPRCTPPEPVETKLLAA